MLGLDSSGPGDRTVKLVTSAQNSSVGDEAGPISFENEDGYIRSI